MNCQNYSVIASADASAKAVKVFIGTSGMFI